MKRRLCPSDLTFVTSQIHSHRIDTHLLCRTSLGGRGVSERTSCSMAVRCIAESSAVPFRSQTTCAEELLLPKRLPNAVSTRMGAMCTCTRAVATRPEYARLVPTPAHSTTQTKPSQP